MDLFDVYCIPLGHSQFSNFTTEIYNKFPNSYFLNNDRKSYTGLFLDSLTENEINRTLFHLHAIDRWFNNSDKKYLLVLEDTVDLSCMENWSFEISDILDRLPSDFKAVQLELIREDQISAIKCITRCSNCWGASAYLITREYVKFLLSHLLKDNSFSLRVINEPGVRPYIENVIFAPAMPRVYNVPLFYICINQNLLASDSAIRSAQQIKNLWSKKLTLDQIFEIAEQTPKKITNNLENSLDESLKLSKSRDTRAIIVDNFYEDPYAIREFALQQDFFDDEGYIGRRTRKQFLTDSLKTRFEQLLDKKITKWEEYGMNGRFQHNWAGEKLVYHCDEQKYAAMVFLTPNAPFSTGTSLWAHRETRVHHNSHPDIMKCFNQRTFVDRTPYEAVDVFGNVFNRLVIFDGGCIHSASEYFGDCLENCRLWHMFFFDAE